MKLFSIALILTCALAPVLAQTPLQIRTLNRTQASVSLQWEGGNGPFMLETSRDLLHWSDQGEPVAKSPAQWDAFQGQAFYRLVDLDPEARHGAFFGLVESEQGEFRRLMGRHRLKSRWWFYRTKEAPHIPGSYTPANYWRKLIVHYQSLEGGSVRTWNGPLENLGAIATPGNARALTVTWTLGAGAGARRYLLTLEFPYSVTTSRTIAPRVSDPRYTFKCAYSTAQPELGGFPERFESTDSDEIDLAQMAPGDPNDPNLPFYNKDYRVTDRGAQVNLHYLQGLPIYEGEPPWIFKTLLLNRWLGPTTGGGGTLPAFRTDSYFARTFFPGHHNFYENVFIEPALDPALSDASRASLKTAKIRYIYTFKDHAGVAQGDPEDIKLITEDLKIKDP